MLEKYYQKVAGSAILDAKGSFAQRNRQAAKINQKCFEVLSDAFLSRKSLPQKTIKDLIKPFFAGVKVSLKKLKSSVNFAEMNWVVSPKSLLVTGFSVALPFQKSGTLNQKDLRFALHEFRHVLDYSINPKLAARANTDREFQTNRGYEGRISKYNDFYFAHLYEDERSLEVRNEQDPKKAKAKRTRLLEVKIRHLFANPVIPSNEKIDVLQYWRYSLLTEKNGNSDQVIYDNKMELKKQLKTNPEKKKELIRESREKTKKEVQAFVGEEFAFDLKIKLVSRLLREEIRNHRAKHSKELHAKGL